MEEVQMEHYKLVLTKDRISVEIASHDREWVEGKEKEYRKFLEQELPAPTQRPVPGRTDSQRSSAVPAEIPVNEFYRKYVHSQKISSRPEIATFFVYYLTKVQNNSDVGSAEVKDLFKQVQYPGWNNVNISDVLNKAKKKALLNSVGNQWSLTITGEDYVLNNLSEPNE
jgi:hypothetical protein